MGTCLVTTLSDVVVDDSLLKLGEYVIEIKNAPSLMHNIFSFGSDETKRTIKIVGDGYFTDSEGTANLGKEKICSAGTNHVYTSTGTYKLIINKYDVHDIGNYPPETYKDCMHMNLDDLYGCGTIVLSIMGKNVKGTLRNIRKLPITFCGITYSGIVGDLADLAGMTTLTYLNVSYTKVTGDTSSLASCPNLTTFIYTNTAITGTWPLT